MTGPHLRVLAVIPDLEALGTQRYVARTAVALRRLGVEVEVCALDRRGPLAEDLAREGIDSHGTSFSRWTSRRQTGVLVTAVREVARLARSGRFDIVHSYLYWGDVIGSLGGRLAGRRVIVSRRALHAWRHEPAPHFHLLETISNLCAQDLVANSRAVLEDAERNERFLPRRRGVIYNGVDPELYRPAVAGRHDGRLRLVTVGALAPRKGQEYGIEALARLRRDGIEARLTLVGGGTERAFLETTARRLGVEREVEFAGEQLDPRRNLEAADIFVFPSRQEGFSNALLEAMASSLPVVATDVGGNAEAVVDGEGGRVVPPRDPDAIARAIQELAADRSRLPAMGARNRERIEKLFSLEASAGALAQWYLRGQPRRG